MENKFTSEVLLNVIIRLVGPIEPTGDSSLDNNRLDSINLLLSTMKQLHLVIDNIAYKYQNSKLASEQKICKAANEYLDWLGIEDSQQLTPMWKRAKEHMVLGENDFFFTLDENGEMSPYWDTEVEVGQYYLSKMDLEKLSKEKENGEGE